MSKLLFRKILARYNMTFGDYVFFVSVDVEHKVLTVFFGDKSTCDKLLSAVIDACGQLRDVKDDYMFNVVCGPDSRMISLGNFKSLIV